MGRRSGRCFGHVWTIELYAVAAAWILFALAFVLRARSPRPLVRGRDRRSLLGLGLEVVGYLIVRVGMRTGSSSFLPLGTAGRVVFAVAAVVVLVASIVLIHAAARTLGRQWSLGAHVVADRELISTGVYALARHPIYTAMFGMLIGTGLAISSWWALLAGAAVFLAGTELRIRAEERLLTAEFGDAYRDYARNVPALIPRWRRA